MKFIANYQTTDNQTYTFLPLNESTLNQIDNCIKESFLFFREEIVFNVHPLSSSTKTENALKLFNLISIQFK